MNVTAQPRLLTRNKCIATIERLHVITSCTPYQENCQVSKDLSVAESIETLDAFNKEYAFKINPELTPEQKYQLLQVLWNYKNAFARNLSEIGVYKHHQMTLGPIDENKRSYRRQFRLSIADAQEIEKQIDNMLQSGIIEPAESHEYNSPVFLVSKKSGAKRLVIDLRGINALLRPKILVLPRIGELIDEIGARKPKYLSSVDMYSGYYQVSIAKDSRKFTCFTSPLTGNRFQHARAPMGCVCSPGAFLTCLNECFAGKGQRSRFYVYVDDLLCLGKTWEEHLHNLGDMFAILHENNLKANNTKCKFGYTQLDFLGHTISSEGIRIARDKFKVIDKIAPPSNRKSL